MVRTGGLATPQLCPEFFPLLEFLSQYSGYRRKLDFVILRQPDTPINLTSKAGYIFSEMFTVN